jgi:hypothetical protein
MFEGYLRCNRTILGLEPGKSLDHESRARIFRIAAEELSTAQEQLEPETAQISDRGFSAFGNGMLVMELQIAVLPSSERSANLRERAITIAHRIVQEIEFPDGVAEGLREGRFLLVVEVKLGGDGCCGNRQRIAVGSDLSS